MDITFNKRRYMGCCENCYYAILVTPESLSKLGYEKSYICHRMPQSFKKRHNDYCGEFAERSALQ